MTLSNVVDYGMIFSGSFADTSAQQSAEVAVSEQRDGLAMFMAPSGVDITVDIQVQDPAGAWHAVVTSLLVSDGTCLSEVLPFNPKKARAVITPSSGAGSAVVWAVAQGS